VSLNVGELVGYLRLDMGDFESGMAKGQALADKLDGKNVDVKVDADTGVAEAKLAGVAASEAKVDEGNKNIAKSGQQAGQGMGALVAAVLLLGPALVPIAAGAVGLAVGFGAMGAAGVLAIVGIVAEMKAGTTLGLQYSGMLQTLKGDLTTLGRTAASGTLQPFQQAVADLQQRMPVLNSIVGEFSVITGKTAGVLTTGLVAAFIALAPLARDAGVYILGLSQRFAAMMSGPGVVTFGDYVRSVFPQVMQAVESIVTAALHLVAAFAPMGMGTLTILRVFTDVINALPVDVLANLATVAGSVAAGFAVFKMLSVDMAGFGTTLQKVGFSAEAAATGVRALNIAAGVIGAILTVAALIFTAHAESVRKDQQAVNDLTDALIRGHGVIQADTIAEQANKLAKDGTLAAAKQLGLNLGDVTAATLGLGVANGGTARMNASLDASYKKLTVGVTHLTNEQVALIAAYHTVKDATAGGTKTLSLATDAYTAYNAATAKAATGGNAQAAAQQALAAKVGTTSAALVLATAAQQTTRDAAAQAAAKMYLENDAAGILKTTLDILNGKTLNAAQAQNSFDSSLVNMGDHVNATGKKITFTTTSIKDMSSASVALRGQLNGQVTNLQAVVEANGGLANSTGKARAQMVTMRAQIINNAVAHGVDRAAVTAYIDKLLAIPKKVPPTKLDVDTATALAKISSLQGYLDRLHSKNIVLTVTQQGSANKLLGMGPPGGAGGRLIGRAGGGGLLVGPGTSTSDSITGVDASGTPIVRVSRDEFVVNAVAYAKNKALVNAINAGGTGGSDMSGVRADLAEQTKVLRALVPGFGAALEKQTRTAQTMQRQYT